MVGSVSSRWSSPARLPVPPYTNWGWGPSTLFLSLPIFKGEMLFQLTALLCSHMHRRKPPGAGLLVAVKQGSQKGPGC